LDSKYNSDEYVRVALIGRAVVVGNRRRAVKMLGDGLKITF
jgi:hypothetical protein